MFLPVLRAHRHDGLERRASSPAGRGTGSASRAFFSRSILFTAATIVCPAGMCSSAAWSSGPKRSASTTNSATSASRAASVARRLSVRWKRAAHAVCWPGASTKTYWQSARVRMPVIRWRVVCGLGRDDRELLADQAVEQARLAGVRAAGDADGAAAVRRSLRPCLLEHGLRRLLLGALARGAAARRAQAELGDRAFDLEGLLVRRAVRGDHAVLGQRLAARLQELLQPRLRVLRRPCPGRGRRAAAPNACSTARAPPRSRRRGTPRRTRPRARRRGSRPVTAALGSHAQQRREAELRATLGQRLLAHQARRAGASACLRGAAGSARRARRRPRSRARRRRGTRAARCARAPWLRCVSACSSSARIGERGGRAALRGPRTATALLLRVRREVDVQPEVGEQRHFLAVGERRSPPALPSLRDLEVGRP